MYREGIANHEATSELAELVFCSFDHSLTQPNAIELKRIDLSRLLKVRFRLSSEFLCFVF